MLDKGRYRGGKKLGSVAHLTALRRESIGDHKVRAYVCMRSSIWSIGPYIGPFIGPLVHSFVLAADPLKAYIHILFLPPLLVRLCKQMS